MVDKEPHDSKIKFTYIKAIKAMKAYPALLATASDAKKNIKGVGE